MGAETAGAAEVRYRAGGATEVARCRRWISRSFASRVGYVLQPRGRLFERHETVHNLVAGHARDRLDAERSAVASPRIRRGGCVFRRLIQIAWVT